MRLLTERFSRMGESVEVDRSENLTAALRRWKDVGIDLLAISGGDGTIQLVIDEVLDLWGSHPLPRFLFLHGGTTGFVARETGNVAARRVSARLLSAHSADRSVPAQYVDTLQVGERHTLSFGIGVFRALSLEYVTWGGLAALSHSLLGLRFAVSHVVRGKLARRMMRPFPHRLRIDGETIPPGHFAGLFAAGLPHLKVFRAYEAIDCPEDAFRVVGIRPAGALTLLRGIRPVLRGETEEVPQEIRLQGVRELTIESADGSPVAYMADGEYYTASDRLSITRGARLTVMRPGLLQV